MHIFFACFWQTNQTVLGVLGVDISIAEIQEIISQYEVGDGNSLGLSYTFIKFIITKPNIIHSGLQRWILFIFLIFLIY